MPRRNRRSPILTDAEAASKVASLPVKASVSILSRTTLPTHSIRIEHKLIQEAYAIEREAISRIALRIGDVGSMPLVLADYALIHPFMQIAIQL